MFPDGTPSGQRADTASTIKHHYFFDAVGPIRFVIDEQESEDFAGKSAREILMGICTSCAIVTSFVMPLEAPAGKIDSQGMITFSIWIKQERVCSRHRVMTPGIPKGVEHSVMW